MMELAEIRFAADSPLEGDGFEPSVPLYILTVSDPLLVGPVKLLRRAFGAAPTIAATQDVSDRDAGDLTRAVGTLVGRSRCEAEAVSAAGFAEGGSDRLVGSVEIELLGAEAAPDPGSSGVVLLMLGVAPGFEEVCIAGNAADILRGSVSGAGDADRVLDVGVDWSGGFEFDQMHPAIAEVVFVEEFWISNMI